ncbi:MAG: MFS transporter [Holosporales bacterium]|nr:MFS transporter [Holosporales bacterium]
MHFFWGMASSMIFSLLPVFIVGELGGSAKSFGFLEGAVVFLSFVAKLFAGFFMDIFKKKLPMLKTGTILTVLSKFFLACAPSVFFVFISKSLDRFAKGLRQAPSDTILAEISPKKGVAYSLRYMMNLSGFLIGSFVTSLIVYFIGQNFRLIFSFAVIPTLVAFYILNTKIKYSDEIDGPVRSKNIWQIKDIALLPKEYWKFLIVVTLLMFNRFSEGFITLKAKAMLPEYVGSFPLFMSMYEICAVLVAIPVGRLSDKFDKKLILLCGISFLVIADYYGIYADNLQTVIAIYIFAGIHMGATQGIIGSIIAKSANKNLIGTAFAIFYGVEGTVLLCSNSLAGMSFKFAEFIGLPVSSGPFLMGIVASLSAIVYIIVWRLKEIKGK